MLPDIDKNKPEKQPIVKMAGYLEKKGRMRVVGVRRWKKRWCVLEGKLLLYFKTQLEYSHHLSPCSGSVNMGLVLSITPRGPCQLQIVTRSQIIIFRTKSKSEQDEWFVALRDAKNNNQSYTKPKDKKSSIMELHRRMSNRISMEVNNFNYHIINENHLRYGRSLRDSFDDIFFEVGKKNGLHIMSNRRSSALRKSESDNRISFYKEMHGLVRTNTITVASPVISEKESCRSRSLSYESIYFKPQEKYTSIEPAKSQSCRELMPNVVHRVSKKCMNNSVSKRMSRSVSFFQKRCEDSDSDDYDYIEIDGIKQKYSKPMTNIKELEQYPKLPPRLVEKRGEKTTLLSTDTQSKEFPNHEKNVDVIYSYVNNDRKMKVLTSDSDLILESGTEQSVEVEDEPPPLPIKKKYKPETFEEKKQYKIVEGAYVFENGNKEVIYDVPIPHGKLIEQFRRLSVARLSPVKRYADNTIYDDSLESSLYETLQMTPDSLEIATMFPTYKRWSNDSGFNFDEPNSFSPDQTHFEDSLEPVIAMINHDRKIWKNVPNINSTDYFR
ncbi:uncharacterized protein LOC112684139 isoform X2 [Sipha flava]|nr:uncharacterized protein LOC112684139 isoform X2 [Sipha flava]